jgi:Fe2+ transport system protein FeoA
MTVADPLVPLDTLPAGARARIRALRAEDDHALLALTGLGLLPGVRLEVLRLSPVLCIRVDGACYAVDRALASGILVEADTPAALPRDGRRAGGLRS